MLISHRLFAKGPGGAIGSSVVDQVRVRRSQIGTSSRMVLSVTTREPWGGGLPSAGLPVAETAFEFEAGFDLLRRGESAGQ